MVRLLKYQVLRCVVTLDQLRSLTQKERCYQAVLTDEIVDGDVVVVRFVGPKGGPGMPEMLSLSSMIVGKGQRRQRLPS